MTVFATTTAAELSCRRCGPGVWQVGGNALAKRSGTWAVVVVDEPDQPADFGDLAAALDTARPADDAELRYLDSGPITH